PRTALDGAVWQARGQLARGELAAARETLEAVVGRAPQALRPRILLSHVLLPEGRDWDAAELALREVLRLDPRQAESWRNLIVLQRQRGWTAEAFAACQAARFYCPGEAEFLWLEGLTLQERGDLRGAEAALVAFLHQPSAAPERRNMARHQLALIYRGQKRDPEAEALWRAVVEEQPECLPAWQELGELFLAQERLPE